MSPREKIIAKIVEFGWADETEADHWMRTYPIAGWGGRTADQILEQYGDQAVYEYLLDVYHGGFA